MIWLWHLGYGNIKASPQLKFFTWFLICREIACLMSNNEQQETLDRLLEELKINDVTRSLHAMQELSELHYSSKAIVLQLERLETMTLKAGFLNPKQLPLNAAKSPP